MSEERKDGGAAFAAMGVGPAGDIYHEHGMSLRDWFAGQAFVGMLSARSFLSNNEVDGDMLVATAFAFADAMLAERSKP